MPEGKQESGQESQPAKSEEGQKPKAGPNDATTATTTASANPDAKVEVTSQTKTFDEEYVKSLRTEAAASRKARQEAETRLQEVEDQDKSESEKATAKAVREQKRADEAEAKLLRFEVGAEKNVPPKLMPLLTGTDREQLEMQADLIIENAKEATPPPDFNGGAREPAPQADSPEDAHNKTFLQVLGLQKQEQPPEN